MRAIFPTVKILGLASVASSAATSLPPSPGHAQGYPEKPIRIISPFPPGNGSVGHLAGELFNLQGYDVTTWYGFWAPAHTPRSIVLKLHSEAVRVHLLPEIKQQLAVQGLEPIGNTPEEFSAQVKAEIAKWARVAAVAGLTPE